MSSSPFRVGIIGAAGFGGSYLSVELLNRGHTVVGISRQPEKLGKHERYIPRPVDIDKVSIGELAETFWGPGCSLPFVEFVRKIILAYKRSSVSYFLFVGGAGSLHVPGTKDACVDHADFFVAYRRAISTSLAHIAYMEERLGIMGTALRRYRDARLATSAGTATQADIEAIAEYETQIRVKDNASDFIKAGRTVYLFFDGNESFKWSFVSPSALYRPGKRTGEYKLSVDDMVLEGEQREGDNIFEGRLTGISVADMAIAIADEIEKRKLCWKHWSATGDISEDVPEPAYLKLSAVEGGSA